MKKNVFPSETLWSTLYEKTTEWGQRSGGETHTQV